MCESWEVPELGPTSCCSVLSGVGKVPENQVTRCRCASPSHALLHFLLVRA